VSDGRLEGKVAVVTGGASGIGLATARRFVAEGACVMIADLNADALATVEAELGDAVAAVRADVSDEGDVEALVAATVDRFGAVHVAFANAGVGSMASIAEVDVADWMRVVEVNLLGPASAGSCSLPVTSG
jgi:NAD(P)-dependent dehydrogenase (short-subunit alcohol dehydrogenase family)